MLTKPVNTLCFLKIVIIALFSLGSTVSSASDINHDSGLWTLVHTSINLKQVDPSLAKFKLLASGEARFFDDFDRFGFSIIRVGPAYQLNQHALLFLGYTWVSTIKPDGTQINEHDINQSLNWGFKQDWGKLSGRAMLEWKFDERSHQAAARLRQKWRADYSLAALDPHLKLIGWDEVFFYLNTVDWGPRGGFNQNRAFVGLGWQLDAKSRYTMELGYLNQLIYRSHKTDTMNHMLFTALKFKF